MTRYRSLSGIALVIAGCFTLLIATGCTTSLRDWKANGFKVGPNYCKPLAPVELEWIDLQEDGRISAAPPNLAAWWHALNDPVLDELITLAYEQNLTLREAGTRIQQAQAIRNIAAGSLFPQVQQAVGGYSRLRTSENVAVPSPVVNFSEWDTGFNLAWELDFWGRFRRAIDAADAELDASIEDYDDVLVLLLSDVATTYVQLRSVQERLEITRQNLEAQQGSLDIAEARYKARQTNKLDVNEAKNNISLTESLIPQLETELRFANNQLCILLGMPPTDLVSQLGTATLPNVSSNVQVGMPADLLRRRPDIRRAERRMAAQSERIGIAETDLYPRISLFGNLEWQAESLGDLFDADSVFGLVSPSFAWNIFNYGRLRNAVELERSLFETRVYQYQNAVLTAQREVEDAIARFLNAQEQAARLQDAVKEIEEAESIALTLYRTGRIDFNRVFLIQSVKISQQELLILARTQIVLGLIQTYRGMGGGWQIRLGEQLALLEEGIVVDDEGAVVEPMDGAASESEGEQTVEKPTPAATADNPSPTPDEEQ